MSPRPRTFPVKRDGQEIILAVRKPTAQEIQAAGFEYSRTYQQALMSGLAPRSRLLKAMRSKGVWTIQDDAELDSAAKKADDLGAKVKEDKFATADEREACKQEHEQALQAFNDVNSPLVIMLSQTCDGRAEERQRLYLLAATVEYAAKDPKTGLNANGAKGGKPLWPNVDALVSEPRWEDMNRVVYEYQMLVNDSPSEWEKDSGQPTAATPATEQPAPVVPSIPPAPPAPPAPPIQQPPTV